jgi:hypothetical protein
MTPANVMQMSSSTIGAEPRQEATLAVNNVKKIWGEEPI